MPEERSDELLPVDPKAEWADTFAFWANVALSPIPVLGTAVSHVLTGWSQERRMQRIKEVLEDLFARVEALGDKRSDTYIGSDEFEDLLDRTLRQVANERHESKRRLYAAILAGAIENPGESSYHEQLRMLRTIEGLQPDHLRILRAMLQEPDPEGSGRYKSLSGSLLQTLKQRLPDLTSDRIEDLADQLTDELRLVALRPALKAMMTPLGAADLRNYFTPYGQRLVEYIRAVDDEEGAEPK